MQNQQIRTARIDARISPEMLGLIKQAAEIQGRSLSDFVVYAASQAAYNAIEEAQIIRLCGADSRKFVDNLLNPPEIPQALRNAEQAHRNLLG